MEEQEQIEQALEMERRRLSELQLRFKHVHNQQYIDYSMEELNASEGHFKRLHHPLMNTPPPKKEEKEQKKETK